jgi:RimJ/RimL family protein N-acetyltransferase
MQPVTLRTAHLELSAPAEADVDAIFVACQDPDIQRYTTVPSPYHRDDAVGFIEKTARWWAEGAEATWAMRHSEGLAGVVGLHRLAASSGAAELGYWVAPAFRGRGLLTEASRAVVEWGFSPEGLGLARIEWRAVVGNVASARAARALGFRYEGLLRGALLHSSGVRNDGWIAGLLAGDDRAPQVWPVL